MATHASGVRGPLVAALAVATWLGASSAHAQHREAPPASGLNQLFMSPANPRHRGGWLFDDAARDALRHPTELGRSRAGTASDVLMFGMLAAPFVTSLAYAAAPNGGAAVLGELTLINVESFALSFGVTWLFKSTFGRERPHAFAQNLAARCREPSSAHDRECNPDRNASFLSGHASTAFTGAGLVCAQAVFLGERTTGWDGVSCGLAMGAATSTALLRLVADQHYATDTLAGAALGLFSGFALPALLHLREHSPLPLARSMHTPAQQQSAVPPLVGTAVGVTLGTVLPIALSLLGRPQGRGERAGATQMAVTPVALPGGGVGVGVTGVSF